jgi:hypothetical protein
MSFASDTRKLRRDILSMLETHRDEFFDFLPRSYSRASPRTSSRALPHLSHGPRFPRRGSCPTRSNGEVQRTVKTSSGHMVKR